MSTSTNGSVVTDTLARIILARCPQSHVTIPHCHMTSELTDFGREQAQELRKKMIRSNSHLDLVVSSPLEYVAEMTTIATGWIPHQPDELIIPNITSRPHQLLSEILKVWAESALHYILETAHRRSIFLGKNVINAFIGLDVVCEHAFLMALCESIRSEFAGTHLAISTHKNLTMILSLSGNPQFVETQVFSIDLSRQDSACPMCLTM